MMLTVSAGASIPVDDDSGIFTHKHEALFKALAEKKDNKVAEARETRTQGLRPKTTAALRKDVFLSKAKKIAARNAAGQAPGKTARARRLNAKKQVGPSTAKLQRFFVVPGSGARQPELLKHQALVEDVREADVVLVPKLTAPSSHAALAMLHGKTLSEGLDISKHKHQKFHTRPETMTPQPFGLFDQHSKAQLTVTNL